MPIPIYIDNTKYNNTPKPFSYKIYTTHSTISNFQSDPDNRISKAMNPGKIKYETNILIEKLKI